MDDLTFSIVRSTATLLKRRLDSGIRTTGKSDSAPPATDPSMAAEARRDVVRTNSLLFM
jgi:hypothetical protein